MKSKLILAIWLATSACALTAQQHGRPPAVAPAAVRPASSVPRPATPSFAAQTPHGTIAKGPSAHVPFRVARPHRTSPESTPVSYVRRHERRRAAVDPVLARSAAAPEREAEPSHKGERDPFVSPIVERSRNSVACVGSGRQCLIVGELSLHGVVQSSDGYIAVVENGEHTYFLRENDPLADGEVEKITHDSITLRQRSFDAVGRPFTRDITKKLGVAPTV